jgi:hypothetical protein
MAVKNDNLLSLLLSYSASHRARHLKQPEPKLRIAHWVQDIIPALKSLVDQAIQDPNTIISTADLATAIMLASLEIISPAAFGVSISWQSHLVLAREIISHRPGGLRRKKLPGSQEEDRVCGFLWSWFAYLDVLGSLSGGRAPPSSAWTRSYEGDGRGTSTSGQTDMTGGYEDDDDDYDQIDCIMGFTPRCVSILAQIAELARSCDASRLDPVDRSVRPDWAPAPAVVARAAELEADVLNSLAIPGRPCEHVGRRVSDAEDDAALLELTATNRAFHWAALVHLHRRILGKPPGHADVVKAAASIADCFQHIGRGGPAEACLLFPMFTAGCELEDKESRTLILERIKTVEGTGMTQVSSQFSYRAWGDHFQLNYA